LTRSCFSFLIFFKVKILLFKQHTSLPLSQFLFYHYFNYSSIICFDISYIGQ
jgi:hypothetical protein